MRKSKVTCPHSYRDKAKELGETATGLELQCDVNALNQRWNLLQHQHKCQNPINCWALVKAFGKRPKELSEGCFGASPANTLSPVTLILRRTQLVSLRENGWFPPTIAERAVQNVTVGTRTSSTDPTRKPSLFCSASWRGALVFILQILWHLDLWPNWQAHLSPIFFQTSWKLQEITVPLYVQHTEFRYAEQKDV